MMANPKFMAAWGPGGPGDPGLRIDGRRPQRQAFQDSTSQVGHELTASWHFVVQLAGHVLGWPNPKGLEALQQQGLNKSQ